MKLLILISLFVANISFAEEKVETKANARTGVDLAGMTGAIVGFYGATRSIRNNNVELASVQDDLKRVRLDSKFDFRGFTETESVRVARIDEYNKRYSANVTRYEGQIAQIRKSNRNIIGARVGLVGIGAAALLDFMVSGSTQTSAPLMAETKPSTVSVEASDTSSGSK